MSMEEPEDLFPRWTIPKRERMDGQNLHISVFILLRKDAGDDSVLFLKAGPNYPVSFKRGKWLLPAAIIDFGEKPKDVVKRVLGEQLANVDYLTPVYVSMQSYLGAHWDIVFVFEARLDQTKPRPMTKGPFVDVAFHRLDSLPREEIAEDHLEVLDEYLREP